jgi:hypothetical protein
VAGPEGFDADELAGAYAELVIAQQPQIVVHVPPQFSFPTHSYHVKAAREFQRLYAEACGVAPSMVVCVQQNAKGKAGEHSHWLACGPEELRDVNRTAVWTAMRSTLSTYPGVDQPGTDRWVRRGRSMCSYCQKHHPERQWQPSQPNLVRLRVEPVQVHGSARNTGSIAYYVTRYVLREDVENAFYYLPGWGAAIQQGVTV